MVGGAKRVNVTIELRSGKHIPLKNVTQEYSEYVVEWFNQEGGTTVAKATTTVSTETEVFHIRREAIDCIVVTKYKPEEGSN